MRVVERLAALALVLPGPGAGLYVPQANTGGEEFWPFRSLSSSNRSSQKVRRVFGPEARHCDAEKIRKSRLSSNIVGGDIVKNATRYPFLAWVGDEKGPGLRQYCGGTLISDRIVLTAAHCLYDSDELNAGVLVRVGLANFLEESGEQRMVVNWRRHAAFSQKSMNNDIALMLLNASISNETIAPVKLSDGKEMYERRGNKNVAGWGSTDEECRLYDGDLREAEVPMGHYAWRCHTPGSRWVTPRDGFDVKQQVCAGNYRRRRERYPGCGDSGGPLLAPVTEGDGWVQVGLVSWSYGTPFPDVYTRVSAYRDWINATSAALLEEGIHPAVEEKRRQEAL